jgi:hypothetical protein
MDITLTCGDLSESNTHRVQTIAQAVRGGDFAKVLQKVRGVLWTRKPLRSELDGRC